MTQDLVGWKAYNNRIYTYEHTNKCQYSEEIQV